MKKKWWIIILLLIVAGWAAFSISKSNGRSKSKDVVRIIKPHMDDIRVTVSSPGTVLPKSRLEIKPPVNGRIDQVLVQEGQQVKTGDTLAWMSSTDRAALLDAARGQGEKTLNYWKDVYKSIPLISPIDGEVIVGTIQPGETVTTVDPVVVLSDRLIVRAQIDETDVGKIKLKQSAVITLDAYPDVKIKAVVGHIYYESKTINNVTVYEVDLNLENVPEFFRSGMNTNVDFLIEEKEDVLVVPLDVIQRRQGKAFVSVQGENSRKTEEREVVLGASDDQNVEIVSGLTADDEIVSKSKKYDPKAKNGTNPFMPSRTGGGRR